MSLVDVEVTRIVPRRLSTGKIVTEIAYRFCDTDRSGSVAQHALSRAPYVIVDTMANREQERRAFIRRQTGPWW